MKFEDIKFPTAKDRIFLMIDGLWVGFVNTKTNEWVAFDREVDWINVAFLIFMREK